MESLKPTDIIFNDRYYYLKETTTEVGRTNYLSNAKPYIYTGFYYLTIQQKNISHLNDTQINVLYNRNSYYLDIEIGEGIERIDKKLKYLYEEEVILTPILKEGYHWKIWKSHTSNVSSCDTLSYNFSMPSNNVGLSAFAAINTYTISVETNHKEFINLLDFQTVVHGKSLQLTLFPENKYVVSKFEIDGISKINELTTNSYTLANISKNHHITIEFSEKFYTIKAITHGLGYVDIEKEMVLKGDNQIIRFYPYDGYKINSILVNDIELSPQEINQAAKDGYVITNIDKCYEFEVTFSVKIFKANVTIQGEGTYTTSSDLNCIYYLQDIILIASAKAGYTINKALVNDKTIYLINNQLILEDVNSDLEILLLFEKKESPKTPESNDKKGMSCSKNKSGSVYDFLFILVTIFSLAIIKKKTF